jgi:hypothetical protein
MMESAMWLLISSLLFVPVLSLAQQTQVGAQATTPDKERVEAIARAKTDLAGALKLPEANLALESATATTWPDASLGCPEKDRMYAQVVTRGWTVRLTAEGRVHELHVAGKRVVRCPSADKLPSR